jgi:hypothetical protein
MKRQVKRCIGLPIRSRRWLLSPKIETEFYTYLELVRQGIAQVKRDYKTILIASKVRPLHSISCTHISDPTLSNSQMLWIDRS